MHNNNQSTISISLEKYGINNTQNIIYNPSFDLLYNEELNSNLEGFEKGQLTELGAVNVMTGVFTGRSPKDKYIVKDKITEDTIWWNSEKAVNDNKPITQNTWNALKDATTNQLSGKKLYVVDAFCGANENSRLKVRFIMEVAWQAHFVTNMFIRPTESELENFEVAHFRLLSDSNFLPYGKSMIEQGRKTWKQLSLMEDAMMIHRIMRAPEKRVFQIDIGNIPPAEVDNYMQKILNKMKKTPIIDQASGEYNLKYNMQNITEDFFLPVRGGDSGTRIESLPGLSYEAVEDIDYLKNKLLAALRVPKAFLGYEESLGSKATLAAEDVRFARTIERIQRITISELTKIAIVHLYAQGYQDADLVDFELDLTNPSTIYETEKVELWNSKTQLASSMLQDGIVSTEWIYKNVFNFTDDKIKEMDNQIVFDYKQKFRRSQIESEGNDPAKSGEAQGTPSDNQAGRTGHELDDEGGSPPGGFEGAGRPKEGGKYGKDSGARGRDPLGAHDKKKQYNPGLALAHFDGLKTNMKKFSKKDYQLINEAETIENEYKEELKDAKLK